MMDNSTQRYVISIMAADRPGIVAAVSKTIYMLQGNISALSQTVVCNHFTILVIADFPAEITEQELHDKLEGAGEPGEFGVMVRKFKEPRISRELLSNNAPQYILSASGMDRKGVIYEISTTLGNNNINIIDIATYIEGDQFVMVAHIVVPPELDVRCVQDELHAIATSSDISLNLQHINIFRETNRI